MYSANFQFAVDHTLKAEGLFTVDTGGKTMYGITEAVWKAYGDHTVPIEDITEAQAIGIYHSRFWFHLNLDKIRDKHIAAEIFDSAVNCGTKKSVEFVQAACNYIDNTLLPLTEDGVLGHLSIARINHLISRNYTLPLLLAMNGEQYIHYKKLVTNSDKYDAYARGWTKRLQLLKD